MRRIKIGKSKLTKKQKQDEAIKWRRQQQKPKLRHPTSMSIDPETMKKEKCEETSRFFGCYLLTSLSPRFKGHSYIGFTVNPKRRIRQHNGEITSGAFRTKKKRPWEMVLCIHGFPTNVAALQFEWAWQHPRESVAVREAAASFKTLGGLANKIKLALTMLTLHSWQSLKLTVSFFCTKYMKHVAGCPSLPEQMKLHFCSMDELPTYGDSDHMNSCDDEEAFESNDSEVSASCSDDRTESSANGSMEMNPSSIHVQSCTTQNSSASILSGDRIGIDGLLESKSSSMVGELEEQPLHQLPVGVSGCPLNISNEQLQPCEETWIEDGKIPFSVLEEHMQPIAGVCASEYEFSPILQEKQSSGDLLADVPVPSGNNLTKCSRLVKEIRAKESRGSSSVIEEHIQMFHQTGPSETEKSLVVDFVSLTEDVVKEIRDKESRGSSTVIEEHIQMFHQTGPSETEKSSVVDFVSLTDDVVKKDKITSIVIDDVTEEQCQPKRGHSPIRSANIVRLFSDEGIEVIELCTPSPDIRIATGSKKRRVASDFPDFIDLTESPSFIQL